MNGTLWVINRNKNKIMNLITHGEVEYSVKQNAYNQIMGSMFSHECNNELRFDELNDSAKVVSAHLSEPLVGKRLRTCYNSKQIIKIIDFFFSYDFELTMNKGVGSKKGFAHRKRSSAPEGSQIILFYWLLFYFIHTCPVGPREKPWIYAPRSPSKSLHNCRSRASYSEREMMDKVRGKSVFAKPFA